MENENRTDQSQPDQFQPDQPTHGQAQHGHLQDAQAQPGQASQSAYALQPATAAPAGVVTEANVSNVKLNYILSIFFTWIPALIFLLTDSGKNPAERRFHVYNMNFQILRVIVGIVWVIPVLNILGFIAAIVLLVVDIMAAMKVGDAVRRGEGDPFKFNVTWVK